MLLFTTYFSPIQVTLLALASVALVCSLLLHIKGKYTFSLILLLVVALCVFSFGALLNPFMSFWDERFHALVAKNLMNHFLKPTLYDDPVVNMPYDRWDRYYIWLHKPPLFLWQIALSFKLFGISEFTLRFPSVCAGVVIVFVSYRIGMLSLSRRVGFLSGVLVISTVYIIELIGGGLSLDHNDVAFLAYVSLSIWAFVEYYFSGKKHWILLIGLFSGMAILCKWLVGLLIYFGWMVLKLQQKKYKLSDNKDLFLSLLVTVIIALPWQVFTFIAYPSEALESFNYNNSHFLNVEEGHSGTFWFHFQSFNELYGGFASFLILPAFYFMYKKSSDKKLYFSILSMILIVYLFFSLAATKMATFTIVVSMLILISLACLFDEVLNYIEQKNSKKYIVNTLLFVSVITIAVIRIDIESLQEKHTNWKKDNNWLLMLTHNKEVLKELKLPSKSVIFNVRGGHYIEAMFYTGFPAYNFIPSEEQYNDLKQKGRIIALFKPINKLLPDYLKNDPTTIIINEELQGEGSQ